MATSLTCTEKFGEIWFLRYASRQTNQQTNRETDILITILHTTTAAEVRIAQSYNHVFTSTQTARHCIQLFISGTNWRVRKLA